ncbi:MAG: heme exporter protein CcmD [Woeseia sp.]|nr:heme exporter protein CcmD [Woeseia sp.]
MELLAMGKYGVYVWSSFALALIIFVICTGQAWRRHKAVVRDIRRRLPMMENK